MTSLTGPRFPAARQNRPSGPGPHGDSQNAERNYQRYLALGRPIGTGVVEGACGHLVKDRFEQSGRQWSFAAAQSLLDLRSVAFHDDWDDFQWFRR